MTIRLAERLHAIVIISSRERRRLGRAARLRSPRVASQRAARGLGDRTGRRARPRRRGRPRLAHRAIQPGPARDRLDCRSRASASCRRRASRQCRSPGTRAACRPARATGRPGATDRDDRGLGRVWCCRRRNCELLREIAAHVRQRPTVYDRWGFAAKGTRGLGISALFAGRAAPARRWRPRCWPRRCGSTFTASI